MAVTSGWYDDEQTIMLYTFTGAWTWEELYPAYQQAIQMENSVPYRVYVILDMRQSRRIPPAALTHLKSITDHQPDNLGVSVFVTTDRFSHALYEMGSKLYSRIRDYFEVAATLEDALAIIARARAG